MSFKVGVIMGSTSDYVVMIEACKVLDELGITAYHPSSFTE